MSRAFRLLPYLIALAVGLLLHHGVADYAHLGRDTWPLIATARVESLADLQRVLGEELMSGLYPGGHFYRPLTSLSYALNFELYGELPRGYHVTDLLLFGACLLGLVSLVSSARADSSGHAPESSSASFRWLFAAGAGVLFALHPAVRDVLPLSARRADLLVVATTLFAVRSSLGARPLLTAAFCLAACLSKESGFLSPLFVIGAAWTRTDAKSALRFAVPSLLALALALTLRTLVLSGLGGHGELLDALRAAPAAFLQTLQAAWMPRSAHFPEGLRSYGSLLFALLCGVAIARSERRSLNALFAVAALGSAGLSAIGGRFESWYAFFPAAWTAVLVARLASESPKSWPTRASLFAPLLLVFPGVILGSPFFESENPWLRASRIAERFEEALDGGLEAALPESQLTLGLTRAVFSAHGKEDTRLRTVPLYAPYSLAGRELLRKRKAPVHFRLEGDPVEGRPGDIQVVLKPRAVQIHD